MTTSLVFRFLSLAFKVTTVIWFNRISRVLLYLNDANAKRRYLMKPYRYLPVLSKKQFIKKIYLGKYCSNHVSGMVDVWFPTYVYRTSAINKQKL